MEVQRNVFFFGDSICFGQGVSLHNGWVSNLSQKIEFKVGNKYTFVNAGVNGNTTRLALERMPYDVQSHGIHTILIQFGLNDCNYWQSDKGLPRVSEAAFSANLSEIISRSRKAGATNIFLNTNHPTMIPDIHIGNLLYSYNRNAEKYNEIIRKVAIHEDVLLNDVEKYFLNQIDKGQSISSLLLEDGLHLSINGHKMYAEMLLPRVLSTLE